MTVVAKNYKALEYVSERLKAYRDIVEATIAQDGYALLYTSEELRMNKFLKQFVIMQWQANFLY